MLKTGVVYRLRVGVKGGVTRVGVKGGHGLTSLGKEPIQNIYKIRILKEGL